MKIEMRGIVQGVGFRPFVFNLAAKYALTGHVFNDTRGVHIEVEGDAVTMDRFLTELRRNPPPLARIDNVECLVNLPPVGYPGFSIRESQPTDEKLVLISPDVSVCAECLRELMDPENRRHGYPFINCTNCGPRYTIIEDVPYDRKKTTMKVFPMCADCEKEYHNPADRRFHAQPNACPVCGPRFSSDLSEAMHRIAKGEIVAVKGIGGYHLACDAMNARAVSRLRERKYREDKPFALMARDLAAVSSYCLVNDAEETLLLSYRRPIVLLRKRSDCSIPDAVAPGCRDLGFMLPYAPVHYLMLNEFPGPLVMTSGNVSDEPIAYLDEEAAIRLSPIADHFLTHNRSIFMRCDDSVTRISNGRESILRRSRGYAPDPIAMTFDFERQILACGAELKNTFCIAHRNYAFMSHHIGDLENLETLQAFEGGIEHYRRLFHLEPDVIAYDLHPEYLSTKYALDSPIDVKIGVQHHHAHIVSCMTDNSITGDVIGVAMDGLGYGLDGNLWGCEFLIAGLEDCERVSHLRYLPMPGGTKAIREPWRMAAAYMDFALGPGFLELNLDFNHRLDRAAWKVLHKVKTPLTSSMGRCFDAVASLIGIRDFINYEGQAAIELERIADEECTEGYVFEWTEDGSTIEPAPVIAGVVRDLTRKTPPALISAKFHNAVVDLIVRTSLRIRKERKLDRVALSGGVFQNVLLLERTVQRLEFEGFRVYSHHRVPTNDGGISLGQAVIANARLKKRPRQG